MKYSDLSTKNRPSPHWIRFAAAGLLAMAVAGCGGGKDGATGPTGATGPAGPAGVNAGLVTSVGSNTVAATTDSANAWKALAPKITVTGVTINSAPVVNFTVKDAAGKPVVGLGNKSKSSTATVAGLTNIGFTLAKLVPASNGAPSKWVSYNVVRPPTVAEKAGTLGTAACDSATSPTWCGTYPGTDTQGTLVDNGDGSYTYTFYRDPKQAATIAASLIDSADGLSKKADLGDLSFDASLTHRLGIQIGGAAPGTGTNYVDGTTLAPIAGGPLSVSMVDTGNAVYDFRPDGTAVASTRNIVKIDSCAACHAGKVLAHGSRKDPEYCVTCHTDQIRYSFSKEAPMLADGITFAGGGVTTQEKRANLAVVNGRAIGNFPNFMHKLHMGHKLVKQGYNYNNDGGPMMFNEVLYPQPVANCVKCHDASNNAVSKTPVTANGDNWKMVPSQLACGSCHDGIDFATGTGIALAPGKTGHVGGAQASDANCASCHTPATVPLYHTTVDPTGANGRAGYPLNTAQDVPTVGYPAGQGPAIPLASQLNMPAGVYKIDFEIKSASVAGAAGAKKATVVYRIMKDGAPVTLNATGYLITNVDGSPDIYVAYAVPQDGIAAPADWNATKSASVKNLRDGVVSAGTQTGPDASGYYTATLAAIIPDNAAMVTAGVGIGYAGFVQLGLAAYPQGIRLREPKFAMKTATGYTARRAIVSADKCNSCHGQLGVEPSFHGGARNNGEGCAFCHDANRATGHVGLAYSFGGGWSVAVKNMVHAIHGSSKREQAFSYEATALNPGGFQEVGYPGVLAKCDQCHVTGSYDFSATANKAALPSLLWTTDSKGNMTNDAVTNPTNIQPIGLSPWVSILGAGQIDYRVDHLVSSPVSSTCFGCHDSRIAVSHMELNGGTLVKQASTVSTGGARPAVGVANGFSFTKVESCMVCHASGKVGDIKLMHK